MQVFEGLWICQATELVLKVFSAFLFLSFLNLDCNISLWEILLLTLLGIQALVYIYKIFSVRNESAGGGWVSDGRPRACQWGSRAIMEGQVLGEGTCPLDITRIISFCVSHMWMLLWMLPIRLLEIFEQNQVKNCFESWFRYCWCPLQRHELFWGPFCSCVLTAQGSAFDPPSQS